MGNFFDFDYDQDAHDAALKAFHFNFGRVVGTVREVVDAMSRSGSV